MSGSSADSSSAWLTAPIGHSSSWKPAAQLSTAHASRRAKPSASFAAAAALSVLPAGVATPSAGARRDAARSTSAADITLVMFIVGAAHTAATRGAPVDCSRTVMQHCAPPGAPRTQPRQPASGSGGGASAGAGGAT